MFPKINYGLSFKYMVMLIKYVLIFQLKIHNFPKFSNVCVLENTFKTTYHTNPLNNIF